MSLPPKQTKTLEQIILERFGEPINKSISTVGISDDRSGKVASRGECDKSDDDDLLLDDEEIQKTALEESARFDSYISWLKSVSKILGIKNHRKLDNIQTKRAFFGGESALDFANRFARERQK